MEVETVRSSRPIVAVGASAGGLEALEKFFRHMRADTGAAFVVVQHLDPQHPSILPELLARYTAMTVTAIQNGTTATPNHVHVIPPNTELYVENGILRLAQPSKPRGQRYPIDALFASLGQDLGARAAGVVLSGTGTDGSQGLRAIKAHGGVAIVQDPQDAAYPGMPSSAAGIADFILPASEMATAVESFIASCPNGGQPQPFDPTEILLLLRKATGQDFTLYRRNTLIRRIQRRIVVTRSQTASDYTEKLRTDPEEPQRLLDDLMINVTSFFRDPEAFEALTRDVLEPLVLSQSELRIWVPGCASGEEAYSLAIAAFDAAERLGKRVRLQIFATDIDQVALATGRQARYTADILGDMRPSLVGRYFVNQGDGYVVVKDVRDACVFARHDVLRDPPFSRMDLVSCRNLLIYLEPPMQRRAFAMFQHALRESGVLFLGSAETVPDGVGGFESLDKKHRLYRRAQGQARLPPPTFLSTPEMAEAAHSSPVRSRNSGERTLHDVVERVVRAEFAPACVVVDGRGEIRYFWGNTGRFFPPPPGAPTTNVFNVVRPLLRVELTSALTRCESLRTTVIRRNVAVDIDGQLERVHLIVRPLPYGNEQVFLVVVQEMGAIATTTAEAEESSNDRTRTLEGELLDTQERLRASIEEVDSVNEQLRAANEELQSANEELLSTNEELQTSQEELQSVNEELNTVNTELAKKVDELGEATAYLQNLFRSSQIATLFLDRNLRISRFTPPVTALFSILETDTGRLITDFDAKFDAGNIAGDAKTVLEDLSVRERVVKHLERDQWFLMRVLPYRTVDDAIEGVVVTFTDISDVKRTERALREAQERERSRAAELEAIMKSVPAAIWITRDRHAVNVEGSAYSYELLRMPMGSNPSKSALDGQAPSHFRLLHNGKELKLDELPLQRAATTGEDVRGFEEEIAFSDGASVIVYGNATPLRDASGTVTGAVGAFIDITELRAAERALRAGQERFRASIDDLLDGFMLLVPVTAADGGVADLRVEYANRSAASLLNEPVQSSATLEGSFLSEVWPKSLLPGILDACREALWSDIKLDRELEISGSDTGDMARALDLRLSRAGDRVALSWHDVTHYRHTLTMLKESHARKEEFLAVLGHELRNPLASIHNALHVLDRDSVDEVRARRMQHLMKRQATALTRLVDDILDVSRISRNKINLRTQLLELRDLVEAALELHRPAFEERAVDLRWHPPQGPLWVSGDSARLGQIIDNLLVNCTKFTDPGGKVEVQLVAQDGAASLIVRDDGIGMDRETLDGLFVPFNQGKQSIDRPRGGLGLGLVLVKTMVELHGGTVAVHSDGPGCGTTITVRLPSVEAPAPVYKQRALSPKRLGRVLIIEDNHDAAESLAEFIQEAWGISVAIAFDGPSGIERAIAERPDVVLCDVGLPGLDGFEVARRLRAAELGPMVLVALTGYAGEDDKARSRQCGFDLHLAKPVEPPDLEKVLGPPLAETDAEASA